MAQISGQAGVNLTTELSTYLTLSILMTFPWIPYNLLSFASVKSSIIFIFVNYRGGFQYMI